MSVKGDMMRNYLLVSLLALAVTIPSATRAARTSATPYQMAAGFISLFADPEIEKAIARLPEDERSTAAARFEAYKTQLRHAIVDYENVEVTPEKAEAICARIRMGISNLNTFRISWRRRLLTRLTECLIPPKSPRWPLSK